MSTKYFLIYTHFAVGGKGLKNAYFLSEHCAKFLACEQALLSERAKRAARERASERQSREGPRLASLAQIGELARGLQNSHIF